MVARACDRYAAANIDDYESGYLERIVKTSTTTKARLLHYFPLAVLGQSNLEGDLPRSIGASGGSNLSDGGNVNLDSWCATHIDHGCLTGLTSALYIDESAFPSRARNGTETASFLPPLPFLSSPPSSSSGLYIHSRTSDITKINIPSDCLAFQTGEALQLITRGRLRAVPHFVSAGNSSNGRIARNTLAVFTQPNLQEVVNKDTGMTFGGLCEEVAGRFV